MRIVASVIAFVFLAGCEASTGQAPESTAQSPRSERISTLEAALAAGDLILMNVRGTGASSGTALDGNLRNTTTDAIRVGVRLRRGLYLANRTATAQNMIATAVYEAGGQYYVGDDEPFIDLPPQQVTAVSFNGYCLDFDLENPTAADSLAAQPIPSAVSDIVSNLLAYERASGDAQRSIVSPQVALWLAQGHTPEEIREKFDFTSADLEAAYLIVAGTF